uniref:Reelin domain-containing protein n=1 Tax=Timema douglasi TaxID=61478 RepID=A0A7R8VTB5_TIMDO|nr:unnamed protein product [Timema douglasi]
MIVIVCLVKSVLTPEGCTAHPPLPSLHSNKRSKNRALQMGGEHSVLCSRPKTITSDRTMNPRVLVLVVLAAVLWTSHGFKSGAPLKACESMRPEHGAPDQDLATFPFTVTLDTLKISPGGTVKVTIAGPPKFKGYFVQARLGDTIMGQFEASSETKLIDCLNGKQNAATHVNEKEKDAVTLTWRAPKDLQENIRFRVTVAKNGGHGPKQGTRVANTGLEAVRRFVGLWTSSSEMLGYISSGYKWSSLEVQSSLPPRPPHVGIHLSKVVPVITFGRSGRRWDMSDQDIDWAVFNEPDHVLVSSVHESIMLPRNQYKTKPRRGDEMVDLTRAQGTEVMRVVVRASHVIE